MQAENGNSKLRAGKFIVIEGTDGSGKTMQFQMLVKHLCEQGYDVATFDFPRHGQFASYFVQQYLNGIYSNTQTGPYTASLFYALDRYDAAPAIRAALDAGKLVIANRYVGSNMAHQGTKLNHQEERRGFFVWLDNLEFELLGIPRPDISFVLRVPAVVAQKLVDQKGQRTYTARKRDIHEADLNHLSLAADVYDEMCQLFPKDFIPIDCTANGKLLSPQVISGQLWQQVVPWLGPPVVSPPKPGPAPVTQKPVPPSRPAPAVVTDQGLRVIFNGASSLIVNRLAPFITPARIDASARSFYVPDGLDEHSKRLYADTMGKILGLQQSMQAALADYLVKQPIAHPTDAQRQAQAIVLESERLASLVSPVAAADTVAALIPWDMVEIVATDLMSSDLNELRRAGQLILEQAQVQQPSRAQKLTELQQMSNDASEDAKKRDSVRQLAGKYLSPRHASDETPVTLSDLWPRNELSLVADILYAYGDQPRTDIQETVDRLTYQAKIELLRASLTATPDDILDKALYSWDIMSDYALYLSVTREQLLSDIEHQPLSPRFGYETPDTFDGAGLTEDFERCFDLSLELYSHLQQAGYTAEAPYATLFGHRMRWQATASARQLLRFYALGRTAKPAAVLAENMLAIITERHPLLAEFIHEAVDAPQAPSPDHLTPASTQQ